MTRIRVALLVSNLAVAGPGAGIANFADELCRAINPDQFAVRLYALWSIDPRAEEPVIQRLRQAGVESFAAAPWDEMHPYRSFWHAVSRLKTVFAHAPVDVMHSQHEFADMAVLWLRRATQAKATLRTVHNEEWKIRPLRRLLLTNGLYPLAFRLEAGVSRAIVERLDRRPAARFLRRRAVVLHPAVNLERFRRGAIDQQAARRGLGIPADAPLVGTVGRLTEQKGFGYFLEAAALVRQQMPRTRFLLIGSGEQEAALRAQAAQLGLDDCLQFMGARPDVEQLLGMFDLFVSSSLWEGLPAVILESMATGIPVVATDIPGTREVLTSGENGRLVPPKDARSLAGAVVELMRDDLQRQQLVAQAFQAVERFSFHAAAAQHERLYQDLLSRPAP